MFTDIFDYVTISGILICYGPLAVTIIGFIAFAALTDGDARRTYLRRIDMRTEEEMPEVLPPVITEPIDAETPSRARVRLIPPQDTAPAADAEAEPTVTGKVSDEAPVDHTDTESDDAADTTDTDKSDDS